MPVTYQNPCLKIWPLKNERAGGFITSRGYRQSKARGLRARRLRDAVLVEHMSAVHRDNYGVYGARNMWHALRRDGIDIGHKQTTRLLRLAGVFLAKAKADHQTRHKKLTCMICARTWWSVNSKLKGPNKLWVADIYECAHEERLCVCHVCHRRLLPTHRWMGVIRLDAHRSTAAASSQPGDRVCQRKQQVLFTTEDHGPQYVSVVYNERLAQHGIAASTGSVGDSYDNALAENTNGSYTNELVHTRRWDDVVGVEIATFKWVSWWNETRLHQSLGYRTPVEVETEYRKQNSPQAIIKIKANA